MGNHPSTTPVPSKVTCQNHDRQIPGSASSDVLLWGCKTREEDRFKRALLLQILRPLKGGEGLAAGGLEYRPVALSTNATQRTRKATTPMHAEVFDACECPARPHSGVEEEKKEENPHAADTGIGTRSQQRQHYRSRTSARHCRCRSHNHETMSRLFHRESNTMITAENRKEFIADGPMYDIVCRLAMEYAQEVMMRDAQLEWVTVPEETRSDGSQPPPPPSSNTQPIRVLVSTRLVKDESRIDEEPTLLVATGNGRVRAGVFSRQHLLTSGLECSTAVPFVRQAYTRNINLVVLDPNARGDKLGMATFEKSMERVFRRWEQGGMRCGGPTPRNLLVLSHSQSGSQFVRYLLDKSHCYLPRIRATAFTDSTHNIQWAKRRNLRELERHLESDNCVYFKRADETDASSGAGCGLGPLSSVGRAVDTNDFWKHRFGTIKTLCAGTPEHSLTNWFVRHHIWNHFDRSIAAAETNRAVCQC